MQYDDFKRLLDAIANSGEAVGEIFEDGKINWKDITSVDDVIGALSAFTGIDFNDLITNELPAIAKDEAKLEEFKAYFKEEFDIPQDKIESAVETAMGVIVSLVSALMKFKKKN